MCSFSAVIRRILRDESGSRECHPDEIPDPSVWAEFSMVIACRTLSIISQGSPFPMNTTLVTHARFSPLADSVISDLKQRLKNNICWMISPELRLRTNPVVRSRRNDSRRASDLAGNAHGAPFPADWLPGIAEKHQGGFHRLLLSSRRKRTLRFARRRQLALPVAPAPP